MKRKACDSLTAIKILNQELILQVVCHNLLQPYAEASPSRHDTTTQKCTNTIWNQSQILLDTLMLTSVGNRLVNIVTERVMARQMTILMR